MIKKSVVMSCCILASIGSLEGKAMTRSSRYGVASLILNRWSPRAISDEALDNKELMALFEAAHFAPSSFNNQPWRFIYARKGSKAWQDMFDSMVEFNQSWAKNAPVLVVVVSKLTFDFNGQPSRTHSFDTGSAWQNLALQGTAQGLVVHGLEGFDYDRVTKALEVPAGYAVEMMIVIGKPGEKEQLSEDLQKKEVPSGRKALEEVVFEGTFKGA